MESKTKERVGPLNRRQCALMKSYCSDSVLPSYEEIKEAGFPFFETTLSDKISYSRQRFRAWASKLQVTRDGTLVFGATGKELLCSEDVERVVMDIHCTNSQKHMKLTSVLLKLKERYSIKRRAFGPAEDYIRDIIYMCPNPQCRFVQVANLKHHYDNPSIMPPATIVSDLHSGVKLSNLSPGKIQDQFETAGIGTVSPTSAKNHVAKNGGDRDPVHCSSELYGFIGDQIDKSSQMKQQQNPACSTSSYSGDLPTEPLVSPSRTTSSEFQFQDNRDNLADVMNTLLCKLSPDKSEYEQLQQGNRNYWDDNTFIEEERISNAQYATTTYPDETTLDAGTDDRRNSAHASKLLPQRNRDTTHSIPRHDYGNSLSPSNIQAFSVMPKLMDVADIIGEPSTSSKVFDDQPKKHNRPIYSQAHSSYRMILPKELPHIYPVSADKLDWSTESEYLSTDMESNPQSSQHIRGRKFRWHERDEREVQPTGEDSTIMGPALEKRRRCEDHNKQKKSLPKKSEAMVNVSKNKRRREKRRKNHPVGNTTNNSVNCMPPIDNYQIPIRSHDASSQVSTPEGSKGPCHKGENHHRLSPMELMWEELRKNKGKEELEVIDKIEKKTVDPTTEAYRGQLCKKYQKNTRDYAHAENSQESPAMNEAGVEEIMGVRNSAALNSELLFNVTSHGKRHRHTGKGVGRDDNNNNMWTVHPDQRYVHQATGNAWEETNDGRWRDRTYQPKAPPAHFVPTSPRFLLSDLKIPATGGRSRLPTDNDLPMDLTVKKKDRPQITQNRYEALDLSMKRGRQESGGFGTKSGHVPVASIKPIPAPSQSAKKVDREPSATRRIRSFQNEYSPPVPADGVNAFRQRERRTEVFEMSSSPTSTDDDISEVASVRVSLYVKTPQKIARAEVVSTIPNMSPGLQAKVSSRVIDDGIDRSSVQLGSSQPSSRTETSRHDISLTPSFGSNSRSYLPEKSKKKRRKRLWSQENEGSHQYAQPGQVTGSTVDSQSALDSQPQPVELSEIRESYERSVQPENLHAEKDDLIPDNVKVNLFGNRAKLMPDCNDGTTSREMSPTGSTTNGMQPMRLEASVPVSTKEGSNNSPQRNDFCARREGPETQNNNQEDQAVRNVQLDKKKRKQREKKTRRKRSSRNNDDVKQRFGEKLRSILTEPNENGFNPDAFLSQKQIEAYEIKMKEAERRKENILVDIVEQATNMKHMYRTCLSDLGKNSLEKIRLAIQRLLLMVRDCRTALFREEAAATCIQALKDV